MKKREKMIRVYAKEGCGCCEATMKFRSVEAAEAAFVKAGLGIKTITDDKGAVHEGIDTF